MLVNDNGTTHQNEFPQGSFPLIRKHEYNMHNDQDEKGRESDEIGGDPGGDEFEEPFCEGRPQVFVANAISSACVLELLEVVMIWMETEVHSLGI